MIAARTSSMGLTTMTTPDTVHNSIGMAMIQPSQTCQRRRRARLDARMYTSRRGRLAEAAQIATGSGAKSGRSASGSWSSPWRSAWV